MALVTFDLDAGPEGAALTTGSSGASILVAGGTGAITYRATAAVIGSFGARHDCDVSVQTLSRYNLAAPSQKVAFSVFTGNLSISPPNYLTIISLRDFATGAAVCEVRWTGFEIRFYATSGTWFTIASVGSNWAEMYRIDAVLDSATGAYDVEIFDAAGVSLGSTVGTSAFRSTNTFGSVQVGLTNAPTTAMTLDVDHLRIDDGATAHLAPPAAAPDYWYYDTGTAWVDVTDQVWYDTGTEWVTV